MPAALLERARAEAGPNLFVRACRLLQDLRTYGVTQVYPAEPGDVAMAMYVPAVSVAQALADLC